MVGNVRGRIIKLHCALSWEKSPAVKRLIVFESPSGGRERLNHRDNGAADCRVGYGLLRLFLKAT